MGLRTRAGSIFSFLILSIFVNHRGRRLAHNHYLQHDENGHHGHHNRHFQHKDNGHDGYQTVSTRDDNDDNYS